MKPHEDSESNERACPGCGALEKDWPFGGFLAKNGELYCCQTCAQGGSCLCNPDEIEESLVKRAG